MPLAQSGFWGPPTSTIDWCEINYEHSRYVCEWFNTLSSFALVFAGVVGIALHRAVLERRFLVAFSALSLVGLGSAAFHATLRFELQMADELPMLYLALVIVFILAENRPIARFSGWLPAALFAHGAIVTALASATRGALQFWAFQLSFGSLELLCLARVWQLRRMSPSAEVRALYRIGMRAYLAAIVVWFIDIRFCSFVSRCLPAHGLVNPQLHAVWHVLVSVGFYALLLLIAHERLRTLRADPRLVFRFGWLPHLIARTPTGASTSDCETCSERRVP